MVRRRFLLAGLVVGVASGCLVMPELAFACTIPETVAQTCKVTAGNDSTAEQVDIGLELLSPGAPEGGISIEQPDTDQDASAETTPISATPAPPPPPENCSPADVTVCAGTPAAPETPVDPGEPALALSDIASFRPASAAFVMEPDGWAVVGLPANFVADAAGHTASGSLLGRAVEVRFTPVAYEWRFSDGKTITSTSRGAAWAALEAREFTDTVTSRRFETSGRVTVQHVVRYSAEYRFAGSVWRSIAGTLEVPGEAREIVVGELDTVLTDGDCLTRPSGPGC